MRCGGTIAAPWVTVKKGGSRKEGHDSDQNDRGEEKEWGLLAWKGKFCRNWHRLLGLKLGRGRAFLVRITRISRSWAMPSRSSFVFTQRILSSQRLAVSMLRRCRWQSSASWKAEAKPSSDERKFTRFGNNRAPRDRCAR